MTDDPKINDYIRALRTIGIDIKTYYETKYEGYDADRMLKSTLRIVRAVIPEDQLQTLTNFNPIIDLTKGYKGEK